MDGWADAVDGWIGGGRMDRYTGMGMNGAGLVDTLLILRGFGCFLEFALLLWLAVGLEWIGWIGWMDTRNGWVLGWGWIDEW